MPSCLLNVPLEDDVIFSIHYALQRSEEFPDSSGLWLVATGNQDAVKTVEHGKLENSVSELEQELPEEGELEDGELSGGWKSEEDDNNADQMNCKDDKLEEDEVEEEDEEEGIVDYRTEGLTSLVVRFGADGRSNQAMVGGFTNQLALDYKTHPKRRKGKGALSRQRKRSRVEKAQKGSKESIIEVNINGRQQGGMCRSLCDLNISLSIDCC